jgi:hypothetical protein
MEMITALDAVFRFGRRVAVGRWLLLSIASMVYSSAGEAFDVCLRVEQLDSVPDAERKMITEALASQYSEPESFNVRSIPKVYNSGNSYYIAWRNSKKCPESFCYYQILQRRGAAVVELFLFQSTGAIIFNPYQHGMYYDEFKDSYAAYEFESPDKSLVVIAFPHETNKLVVQAERSGITRSPPCRWIESK